MDASRLSVSALGVNARAYSRDFCDAQRMGEEDNLPELYRLFKRRLQEEMDARQLSQNAISRAAQKAGHDLRQSSISRILKGKQDPTLGTINAIVDVIGLPAWYLLTEPEGEQRVIRTPKVVSLQRPDYSVMKRTRSEDKPRQTMAKRRR